MRHLCLILGAAIITLTACTSTHAEAGFTKNSGEPIFTCY
jgi:hypothetical protein